MFRYRLTLALLMNVPMSLCLTLAATLLNIALGHGGFVLSESLIGLGIAYVTGVIAAFFLPSPRWGQALARRAGGGKFVSFFFPALLPALVNTFVISLVMTVYRVGIVARAGALACLIAFLQPFLPLTVIAFFVAGVFARPMDALARRITRFDPAREEGESPRDGANTREVTHED